MCGRYTLDKPQAIIERFFVSLYDDSVIKLSPRFNIAPGQKAPVIFETSGERHAKLMTWGLIPSWSKDRKIGYRMINARAETVDEKPSFRNAFKSRRCIIPASASTKLEKIHDRMPVILEPDEEKSWLSNSIDTRSLRKLFDPFPDQSLQMKKVSTDVNNPKNDDEKLIQQIE